MCPPRSPSKKSSPKRVSANQQDNVNVKSTEKIARSPGMCPTFNCQLCRKEITHSKRLIHMLHHLSKNTGIKRFQCMHCKQDSNIIGNMKKHLNSQHNDENGFVDRLGEMSEDIEKMSLLCFNSQVVLKTVSENCRHMTRLRAVWPDERKNYWNRISSKIIGNKKQMDELPDADGTLRDGNRTSDDADFESNDKPEGEGDSEQNASSAVVEVKNENPTAQDVLSEIVGYWAHLQPPNSDYPENTASSSIVSTEDEVEMFQNSGVTDASVESANISGKNVKQEVEQQPTTQVHSNSADNGEKMNRNADMMTTSCQDFLDDQTFYEMHRLQKKWNKKELVDHVRIVARRMECSEERIEFIVNILEKNDMDGIALSFEDENLTNFFKQNNIAYGAKVVMIQILKNMKIGQLNNVKC